MNINDNFYNSAISPLHYSAQLAPHILAIKSVGKDLSYSQASQIVQNLVIQLKGSGLSCGDRLAVISPNNLETILLYWACIDLGVLYCPISYRFPHQQIDGLLNLYGIKHYWSAQAIDGISHSDYLSVNFDLVEMTNKILEVDINRSCNLIFTSGSSGQPKAAIHTLVNHISSAKGSSSLINLHTGDNWLLSLPLFHIGGLAIVNRCALAGACVVIKNEQQHIAEQLIKDRITHVSLVSTQLLRLLNDNIASLSQLKALLLGGGAIHKSLIERLADINVSAFTSYGMTEMSSQITTGIAIGDESSGKLLADRELDIRDGVIWVRGKVLFQGYLQSDGSILRQTDAKGWFCSKDCGYWDQNGNLVITGRSDNMFVCGGENLHPEEVENALKLHQDIDEAIVFSIKDKEFGLLPAAIIKTVNNHLPSLESIEAIILNKIARFKRPRCYFLWPENVEQISLKVSRNKIISEIQSQH